MSITKEQARLELIEEMKQARVRNIPVRCVHHSYAHLNEGELGLVSAAELQNGGRAYLKVVECPEWDSKGYAGYGSLTKKKSKKSESDKEVAA